nr:hypothetical protein [Halomicroarcula nitratireducens]
MSPPGLDNFELITVDVDSGQKSDIEVEPFTSEFEQLLEFLLKRPLGIRRDAIQSFESSLVLPQFRRELLAFGDVLALRRDCDYCPRFIAYRLETELDDPLVTIRTVVVGLHTHRLTCCCPLDTVTKTLL